jgi:hypothetical protein
MSGSSKEMPGEAPEAGTILLVQVAANIALGVVFFLFLLGLPSDPENALVGRYSLGRLLLIVGILTLTIAFTIIGISVARKQNWRTSLGERIYGRRGWVRRWLPMAAVALMALYLIPLLFTPVLLEELSNYYYIRLAPYLLWPWALLVSFALASWIHWARPRIRIGPTTTDGFAVVGLFLVSFAARAPLSGYGLPYQAVWDEVVTYSRALELISGETILENGTVPGFGRASYGDPITYVTAAGQAAGLFTALRTGQVSRIRDYALPADGVGTVFEAVHDSGAPLRYPRLLFALINSLTPVLIYVALRRHLESGIWTSMAGGLVYAVFSTDVIYYSAFIGADATATTLALAAMVCGLEVIRSQRATWIPELACGLLVGVTVSVSLRYVGLIPLPFIALAFSRSHERWTTRLALMAAGLTLGFLATSPSLLSDLPGYLGRVTSLTWVADGSLKNRVLSLAFYLRGAFLGRGFGVIVLGLSLVGYIVALQRHRRETLFLTLAAILHLLAITPTVFRATRHALALYPLAAIFAAVGLGFVVERFVALLTWYQGRMPPRRTLYGMSPDAASLAVFLLFLAVSVPKMLRTAGYVDAMHSFKPSQVRMAEFVRTNLDEGTKIGLLDIVPFTDQDVQSSGANIERVGLDVTMDELRREGIEYVLGTDLIGLKFGGGKGTIWVSDLISDDEVIATVGEDGLGSRGWPVGNLLLYLSRVPPLEADP